MVKANEWELFAFALKTRALTCFECKWILEDLTANGKLTEDYPPQGSAAMEPLFPIAGKLDHVKLEGLSELVPKSA